MKKTCKRFCGTSEDMRESPGKAPRSQRWVNKGEQELAGDEGRKGILGRGKSTDKGPDIGEVNEIISLTFGFHVKYQNINSLDITENSLP